MELTNYLATFKTAKGETATHTIIGDKALNIYGGAYTIPEENWLDFMETYWNYVFYSGNKAYMTEKQLDNGAVYVDLDFRYAEGTNQRFHTEEHILDVIMKYYEKISEILDIPEESEIKVFVMEKDKVNQLDNKTKDGIHILFGIKMTKECRKLLRQMVKKDIQELLSDLPLTNTIEDVIDEGIANSSVNCQMYGSRKPGYDAYKLTHKYIVKNEQKITRKKFTAVTAEDLLELSVQYDGHPEYPVKENILELVNEKKQSALLTPPNSRTPTPQQVFTPLDSKNEDEYIDLLFNVIGNEEINGNKTVSYQDRLCIRFILKSNNYDKQHYINYCNLREGKGKDNADEDWEKLNIKEVTPMYVLEGLAKRLVPVKYKEWLETRVTKDIDIYDATDYGRAKLYLSLIGDNFQYKDKVAYIYDGRLWNSDGEKDHSSLMKSIQDTLIDFYGCKVKELTDKIMKTLPDHPDFDKIKKLQSKTMENLIQMKKHSPVVCCKSQVLIHADKSEVNFDTVKPYYFVFKNKAFDFETGSEVTINKYDYITQSVNYKYVEPTQQDVDEMNSVLKSILPNEETLKSFLSALRTACTGRRIQKFIMMTGGGRNGKGLINQLMKYLLQGYFYQGNINSITEKVKSGANPEVANMNKKRMVCFGEPEDNQQLMLGAIKALTGEDTINARGLFQSNTETNLQLTLFLEVNGKPNVCGKIGAAIQERFILYNFPNLFTDDESLIDNVTRFKQNRLYETAQWRERIRHALFHILLNLKDNTGKLINEILVTKSVKDMTHSYLESKDELSNWIDEEYIIVDNDSFINDPENNHISLKDMYLKFRESSMYSNSSKYVKRTKYSKNGFEEEVKENIKVKPYYVKEKQVNKLKITNGFIRMRSKTDEEKGDISPLDV
jgi:hypothetical protein